jgi:DNA-binding IclR family transcriptional regulator
MLPLSTDGFLMSGTALTWLARRAISILARGPLAASRLAAQIGKPDATVRVVLADLRHLGIAETSGAEWHLTDSGQTYAAWLATRR